MGRIHEVTRTVGNDTSLAPTCQTMSPFKAKDYLTSTHTPTSTQKKEWKGSHSYTCRQYWVLTEIFFLTFQELKKLKRKVKE